MLDDKGDKGGEQGGDDKLIEAGALLARVA